MKVVVTGSLGVIGRRLTARLTDVGMTVVGLDGGGATAPGDLRAVDLATSKLEPHLVGADCLVHLGTPLLADATEPESSRAAFAVFDRVTRAASACGVSQLVVLSSAMVYGAWPNNPVPLTEDAPTRPNPGFLFAAHHAELERRASEWRAEHPAAALAVLRPAPLVADEQLGRVASLLRSVATVRTHEGDAPAQFLHIDDLVEAIRIAVEQRVDGVLNVAPDGWIPPETLGALAYPGPRPMLPMWLVNSLAQLRWRLGLAAAPPGLVPYTVHPWVVSADRARSLGWQPSNTNEEAYVLGHEATPFDRLNARRRQQISLGVALAVLAAVVGGLLAAVLRSRRRR